MRSKKKKLVTAAVAVFVVACIACTGAVVAATSAGSNANTDSTPAATVNAQTETVVPDKEPDIKPYIVPGELKGLKISKVSADSISLVWQKSSNVTGYKIYRAAGNGSFALYKTISAESFTDSVNPATKYQYRIEPLRSSFGIDKSGKTASVSVLTKPNAVSNLHTEKKKLKSVTLKWNKNTQATSYIVYRANGNSKSFKKLCETTKASLKDKKLSSGTVYSYKVEAVCKDGKLSASSDAKTIQTMTRLEKPKKLDTSKTTLHTITLKWNKVKGAQQYEIRKNKKLVATVKSNSYKASKLKHSTVYNYSVKAVASFNGKNLNSRVAKISASTNVKVPYVKGGLSGTWVMVNISTQTMTMYVNNKPYVKTPVVTGNAGALSTTKGLHHVLSRKSPARLRGSYGGSRWDTMVNYWLGFTYSGQGIHDSTWRGAYGGHIYQGNGSHGCVNTPLGAVAKIYAKAYVGMPVVVY